MRKLDRVGFTLIELLVVLALIAILSSLAIPRVNMSRFRADTAMRTVQSVLQQAEQSAVQRQMDVVVSFDTAQQRIRILYDENDDHQVSDSEEVQWKYLDEGSHFAIPPVGVNGHVESSVVGDNLATSDDGYPTVYYRRDGAASSDFEVYVRSSVDDSNDVRALVVTQATGRVTAYHYGNGTWQAGSL